MSVKLNHTIVYSENAEASANFLSTIMGLSPPKKFAHFYIVETSNEVSLDFMSYKSSFAKQHYAFLVDEIEFDAIFARIKDWGLTYWADPGHEIAGTINTRDGGRGCYFNDPNGHNLEILTRPYGSDSEQ